MSLRWMYEALLRVYPGDYRKLFGAEMLTVFDQAAIESRRQGIAAFLRFLATEWAGAIVGAGREWKAKLSGHRLPDEVPISTNGNGLPAEVLDAERLIQRLIGRMEHAIANHQFERARFFAYAEAKERVKLQKLREKYTLGESPEADQKQS